MPLGELLKERFKVRTRAVENPKITASAATAQVVLGSNPNRLGFTIINHGANPCFVGLTNEVSASRGIRLDASGGSISMIWDEDFDMVAWAWWIISPAGASNIYSIEVIEY